MTEANEPAGYAQLVSSISESHRIAGDSPVHAEVLKNSMAYMLDNYTTRHWFCDPYMFPVATHTLILFSFPSNPALENIKPKMVHQFETCENCIRAFANAKAILRRQFMIQRKINAENVQDFINVINKWVLERAAKHLFEYYKVINASQPQFVPLTKKVEMVIYEFLYQPQLNMFENVNAIFIETMKYLLSNDSFPKTAELCNSLITFALNGTPEQSKYSLQEFDRLKAIGTFYTLRTFDLAIADQLHYFFYRIQNNKHYTVTSGINFWIVFNKVLSLIDNDVFLHVVNTPADIEIERRTRNIDFGTIISVLLRSTFAYSEEPLPVLLEVLNHLLTKLKDLLWRNTVFNCVNVLDTIASPYFAKHLCKIADHDFHNLTDWMFSLPKSVTGAHVQSCYNKTGIFMLEQSKSPELEKDQSRARQIRNVGCDLLLHSFAVVDNTSDIRKEAFSTNLLRRRDARVAIDSNAHLIVELAVEEKSAVAQSLIAKSIELDLDILSHNTYILQEGKDPKLFDYYPLLYHSLKAKEIYASKNLSMCIIQSMKMMVNVSNFIPKKNDEIPLKLSEARRQHNIVLVAMFGLLNCLLDKISLTDSADLEEILSTENAQLSLWSCIFCPDVSQTALSILYQVFDTEDGGRFEAIQTSMSRNLKLTLKSIIPNLENLVIMLTFEPSPKAIRICMDIVKVLADPLNGILSNSPQVEDCKFEIKSTWDQCWSLLIMVYRKTQIWAGQYQLSQLTDFCRDTLDLSHNLLNSFRLIVDKIACAEITSHSLFQTYMDAFNNVVVWLRLGDKALLDSCVELVFKGFDLATDLDFEIDKTFITTFVKYGLRLKKYKTALSEQQRSDILSRAREMDPALVDLIVKEETKITIVISDSKEESKTPTPPMQASYKYESQKASGPRQQTLGRYGVSTLNAPVAPPPKNTEFRSSGLDAIRKELISARTTNAKPKAPIAPPAPPRPAGFNSKKTPTVGRSLNTLKKKKNDDESSDEEELDVDTTDIFVRSEKKPKVVEVDYRGRPITKNAHAAKIDEARKEEERMRKRLNINLKPLYSNVLKWNYNSTDAYPTSDREIYTKIKSEYLDAKDYVKTTEPLLMLECWQGIQSAKQTSKQEPFALNIGSRTSIDGFFDVFASIQKSILSDRKIGESDLLVLGHANNSQFESSDQLASYMRDPSTTTCLAKVREIKSANNDFSDIILRVYPQGSMMGILTPKMEIVAMRVMQMITVEREFSSLKGLEYYDLCDQILKAQPNKPTGINDSDANKVVQIYDVNKSQANAILGSYKNEGFSLIQGPPGTGKTKTILGIVGYFLSQHIDEKIIEIPSDKKDSTPVPKNIPKVLICAPSNAAVDELCIRIRNGVKNDKGKQLTPRVVRLGRSDAANAAVRDLTLEELVEQRLLARNNEMNSDPTIRQEHTKCITERNELRSKLQRGDLTEGETSNLESKLRDVNKTRNDLAKKLDEQRERISIAYRTREIERRNIQAKILSEAQIICSTLSGSAHDFLASLSMKFDSVIIDEACQCVELSAIIPLRYGCKRCIMVGDPNQLPPTVLSQAASSYNYEQSLFVRMQQNYPESVYLLDVQYRMHPEISRFPSSQFYKSRLHDGKGMEVKNTRKWHAEFPLTPYRFFNIVSKHQANELSRSLYNVLEAQVALEMVEKLIKTLPDGKLDGKVGIISPYKEQIRELKRTFTRRYGLSILNEIDFNTVDGFQGQEKEIIIMSCVRASENGNVGFLGDVRRMNVALTRARTTLWILGNQSSLLRNKVWKKLIDDASSRGCITDARPGFLNRPIKRPITTEIPSKRSNDSGSGPNKKKRIDNQTSRESTEVSEIPNSSGTARRETPPASSTGHYNRVQPTSSGFLPSRRNSPMPESNREVEARDQI